MRAPVLLLIVLAGCYADGAIGATTPVSGPAGDGAMTLFSGDVGAGAGYIGDRGGFSLGVAGQRVPTGRDRNAIGGFARLLFPGGTSWLRGTLRVAFAVQPGVNPGGGEVGTRSLKVALGAVAHHFEPEDELIGSLGPTLTAQWVDIEGVGSSLFIGLELSALFGGKILDWSDSAPDDV